MEDQALQDSHTSSSSPPNNNKNSISNSNSTPERNEPVRSRWNPKPEQILILESIFNSGMVNPPKEETVRIRKLLEKFGSVGDANVFYWFQNRRSRSRRRQRQLQASLEAAAADHHQQAAAVYARGGGGTNTAISSSCHVLPAPPISNNNYFPNLLGSTPASSSSSSSCGVDDEMLCLSGDGRMTGINNPGIEQTSSISPSMDAAASNLPYQPAGIITVFINGVATEVPRGPINMKAWFGDDEFVLYHSSGIPIPINEFGILLQSLRHGESYFLVSRAA